MYNASTAYKTEIKKPSRSFECKVTIGDRIFYNDDIVDIIIDGNIQPQEGFSIGNTVSQTLDLTLINKGDTIYSTNQIKVEIGLKIGNTIEYIQMGLYNIDDVEKTDYTIKFTAFDNMIKFETSYFSNLGDTPTLQQVVNELVSKTGVQFIGSLPSYTVKKLEGFTCREILSYVASLCGGNALITRDGKFTIVYPKDINYSITADNYFDYKREEVKYKIGKVTCQVKEKEIISKGSLGTDSMELLFENPWVTETILTDIYNRLNGFNYLGYNMKWQGDLSIDVGDIATVTDKKGVVRKLPILSQKFTYTGGLTSEIAAKGESKNKNSFSSSGNTANKVNRVVTDLALVNKAFVDYAHINDADIKNLKADTAKIHNLEAETANINTILAGSVGSGSIQTIHLTGKNVVIDKAIIKDTIAANISVQDLKAGNIDANRFNIVGPNGNLLIKDNTIQIKDNDRTRVQIGKDASNDYNMYVWDATGKLMFDAAGLKADGIKEKIIRDDMITDNANINGSKINISSLVTEVNKDTNTQLIKASKVAIDLTGQSLEVSFNSIKSNVDSKESRNLARGTQESKTKSDFIGAVNNNLQLYKFYTIGAKVGDYITVSFDLEYTNLIPIQGQAYGFILQGVGNVTGWNLGAFNGGSITDSTIFNLTETKKVKIIRKIKLTENHLKNDYWDIGIRTDYIQSGKITVTNFKGEIGENFNPIWSLAPEDTEEKIQANTAAITVTQKDIKTLVKDTTIEKDGQNIKLKDAYASFTQEYDKFKFNVTSNYTTKTETNVLNNQLNQNKQNIRCNDLGAKINYSAFATPNSGEIYLHGFDSSNNPIDSNGKIYWNGIAVTVPKGVIDVNGDCVLGEDIYLFMNVVNQGVIMGTWYDTLTNSWKYKMLIGGTSTGALTPTNEHIALGVLNMKNNESFNYAYLFESPKSLKALTIGSMDILTRMNNAELKITNKAIISTVQATVNQAKTDAINSANSATDTKLQSYATKASMEFTADQLKLDFSSSGGYNLVKNSGFFNDTNYWSKWGYASSILVSNSDNGYGKKLSIKTTESNQGVQQVITGLEVGKIYTLSAYVCSASGQGGIQVNNNGNYLANYTIEKGKWELLTRTFTASSTSVTVQLGRGAGGSNGEYYFTAIMLQEGSIKTAWSPNASEIYNGVTKVDGNGIEIIFDNGKGKAKMGKDGFFWQKDSLSREYHCLSYKGEVSTNSNIQNGVLIQLPLEFKGKDFEVIVAPKNVKKEGGYLMYWLNCYYTERNTSNATFKVHGVVDWRSVDNHNILSSTGITVTYVVLA